MYIKVYNIIFTSDIVSMCIGFMVFRAEEISFVYSTRWECICRCSIYFYTAYLQIAKILKYFAIQNGNQVNHLPAERFACLSIWKQIWIAFIAGWPGVFEFFIDFIFFLGFNLQYILKLEVRYYLCLTFILSWIYLQTFV